MKYFLIAGEASGDLHAAGLIEALRKHDADASFVGLGGDRMQAAGCRLYQHYRKMAYMGYMAVITHLGDICRTSRITQQALLHEQPDELILIDYPGFNVRIAEFCRKHLPNTRVTYFIPPKVWAWKRWRIHSIGKNCHHILGIFPFEPSFYAKYGYTCSYVGNPVVQTVSAYIQSVSENGEIKGNEEPYIALLPGSRSQEIEHCLHKMIEATELALQAFPAINRIVVTTAPGIDPSYYQRFINGYSMVELRSDTYNVVRNAAAAVVNSGTATLETALLDCPQVAVYHLAFGHLVQLLRPIIFQIPYFTLVNIVAGREVIRELLTTDFTIEGVRDELCRLLANADYVANMRKGYADVRRILGLSSAADTAAKIITSDLK